MTERDLSPNLPNSNADIEHSSQTPTESPPASTPKITRLPPPTLASVADPGRIRFGAGFRIKPRT